VVAFLALLLASALDQALADVEAGRLAQAEAALKSIVAAEAKNARAWKALGVVYAMRSMHEVAEEPFRNACTLDPREPDACYFYGRNQYALNKFEASIGALRQALPIERRPARVHLGIAQAEEALGNVEKAQAAFRTAIKANANKTLRPDDDPRIAYSTFLYRQGKLAEARAAATSAVADHPASAKARVQLGRVLAQLGETGAAAGELEKAVAINPNDPQAHLLLGKAYTQLGRTEEGRRHLERAQQIGLR
jgi:Flp pilus assembly protein TadD